MLENIRPTRMSKAKLRRAARERFARARRAELSYQRQLVAVSKHVGHIIKTFAPKGVISDLHAMSQVLRAYSEALTPWAQAATERMHAEVSQRDYVAWRELGVEMGRELRKEINNAPTGHAVHNTLAEQVALIQSIPLDAAKRVHSLVEEALLGAKRPAEVAKEIQYSTHVSVSKAQLIARTEVARTASVLTQSRAQYIGSEGYIWRTASDSDVRDRHKHLEGKLIRWDSPPVAGEDGERAHAGCIYNCRCYPEPVIPDMPVYVRRAA